MILITTLYYRYCLLLLTGFAPIIYVYLFLVFMLFKSLYGVKDNIKKIKITRDLITLLLT